LYNGIEFKFLNAAVLRSLIKYVLSTAISDFPVVFEGQFSSV
jgi:hypothetical protein